MQLTRRQMVRLTGAAAGATLLPVAARADAVKIKIGHTLAPRKSNIRNGVSVSARHSRKNTNGRYVLEIYKHLTARRRDPNDPSGTRRDAGNADSPHSLRSKRR